MIKQNYVYDIETYPNFFCAVFLNGKEEKTFEISGRKNDLENLINFYNTDHINYAIGFNCTIFDAQVLQFLVNDFNRLNTLNSISLTTYIYEKAQMVIEKSNAKEFLPFPEWKVTVPQIDLFLINHYNNKNKMTSLKWIEFGMNFPKVQDLPYKFNLDLSPKHFDEVIEYCKNDVGATRTFAEKNRELIKLRISQDKQYPELYLRNKPDSSVGETLFLHFMSQEMGIDKKELKKKQTHRGSLDIKDLILPYINFKTPEFSSVLDFYKNAKSGGLSKTLRYKGVKYEYGEGGLHASVENKIYESNDEYLIRDYDGESFYPNLSIINGFKPEHLGNAFMRVYKNIFEQRKKHAKGTPENASYKLLLNSNYGKMGDEYSFLFDKKAMLEICVNGQLLLTMLTERFSLIEDCEIIQCNTDGVTVYIKRDRIKEMEDIASKWEKITNIKLEYVDYKKMAISNVNNYLAEYMDGKVKRKGMYEIEPDLHKNKSQAIVPITIEKYLLKNIPIRETIEKHLKSKEYNGIYDFCIGKKVKWNQEFVLIKGVKEERIKEKVIRYYITSDKATMMKKYNDGRISAVNKGYNAKLFQEYESKKDYKINYEYYINECYKITTPFDGGNPKDGFQLKLF